MKFGPRWKKVPITSPHQIYIPQQPRSNMPRRTWVDTGRKLIGKGAKKALNTAKEGLVNRATKTYGPLAGAVMDHLVTTGVQYMEKMTGTDAGGKTERLGLTARIGSGSAGKIDRSNYTATYKKVHRTTKLVMDLAVRFQLNMLGSYRLASNIGTQGIGEMNATGKSVTSAVMFGGALATAATYSPMQAISAAFQVNAGSANSTSKILFESVQVITTIENNAAIPISVDLYECVAKLDYASPTLTNVISPQTDWTSGYSTNVIETGITGSVTTPQATFSGVKPTQSMYFNTYWKVCGKVTLDLSVGSTHKHFSNYKYDMILDAPRFNGAGIQTYQCLGGYTRSVMCVIRGDLVRDTVTAANIQEAAVACNIQHEYVYHAKCLQGSKLIVEQYTGEGVVTTPEAQTVPSSTPNTTTAVEPA